ncbi:MAG TPA: hypothetical protein VM580_19775, partial [Labilithrix sp.]|nr:hypothetical protein [Labilithrix sp.]
MVGALACIAAVGSGSGSGSGLATAGARRRTTNKTTPTIATAAQARQSQTIGFELRAFSGADGSASSVVVSAGSLRARVIDGDDATGGGGSESATGAVPEA